MLSFIVPAHDEAPLIGSTVHAIRAAALEVGLDHEIVVVDDASSDATAQVAQDAGARVVRIAVRQIAAARNAGAAAACGEAFVFVDADTLVNAAVVRGAVSALRAGAVGGGAAVHFDEPTPFSARGMSLMLTWASRFSRLACGCFVFCTRRAFEAVGGFDQGLFAAEEIALSRALGRQGRFVILREAVLTSGRKLRTHSRREIFGAFARIVCAGPRGVRDRSRLALWYGPRRKDPAPID